MVSVPWADGVYVTVHVAEAVLPESRHEPLNVPDPLVVRAKLPVGVTKLPSPCVSVTVTRHEEAVPAFTGLAQLIVVSVVRLSTVILNAVAVLLPLWVPSPL